MNIFITGANGFIGSSLMARLAGSGHGIHAFCRTLPPASFQNRYPSVHYFIGDIRNYEEVEKAMSGCQQVYHLAGFTKLWAKDNELFNRIHIKGTENVLHAAQKLSVGKVVYTSTAAVYGTSYDGIIEEDKIRHIPFFNLYESSKFQTEIRVKDFVIKHGLDVVLVNPTRVYGPWLWTKPTSVNMMIERFLNGKWRSIPGNGNAIGNYVFIDDVVDGHIAAMEKGEKGENYILGGFNHRFSELFEILKEVSGLNPIMFKVPPALITLYAHIQMLKTTLFRKPPSITPGWIPKTLSDYEVNIQKMKTKLGIEPKTLKEGLSATVKWVHSGNKLPNEISDIIAKNLPTY